MDDLISKLSEIRSEYNCFDEDEEPYYRALSKAISILSRRTDGDLISRQAAIDAFRKELCREREYATPFISFKGCERILNELPSTERLEVQSSGCEYWDNESNFCALYRPSAERRGRWTIESIHQYELAYGTTAYEPVYKCSCCGLVTESYLRLDEPIMPDDADFPKWCGNCGARMEADE